MLKNMLEILPYPEIPRVHKCCGSIFFFLGGGGGWGGGKFINFTLFRYQTDCLYFSTMILKALQLMGS